MSAPAIIPLYRVENPLRESDHGPDGVTSHADLIGQWFSPDIMAALIYLRKSTQTFGKNATPIAGAQIVVAHVPADEIEAYHVTHHPVASSMDVENDNYLIPRDGSIPTDVIPLDETLGELRGQLGNVSKQAQAAQRVQTLLGSMALYR